MTSPASFQPPAFNLAQPPPPRRNPSLGSNAVQSPSLSGHSPSTPQYHASSDNTDAIRNGKQRAKDIMAASGLGNQVGQNASPGNQSSTSQVNGVQMTRKRSRSGSRIPARASSTSAAPELTDASRDEQLLERYIQRDLLHAAAINDQAERARLLIRSKEQEKDYYFGEGRQIRTQHPGAVFGYGYNGYGNGRTDQKTRLEYPGQRRRAGNRRTRELKYARKDNSLQAECLEELVPVRLDIELDKLRLRDTFTWNLNDRIVPPQIFAEALVEDLRLPMESSQQVARQVHQEMVEQIRNYYPPVRPSGQPAEPLLEYWAHKNDDIRIMVRLNITIGHITLVDQFEWDINDPNNSPEDFAKQMALDLSLSGEFTTAIAHSIREQSQLYTRSLYLTNYEFDGRPIEDPDIRENLLPSPVGPVLRPQQAQKDFAPYLFELNEADLEKTELSMMREQRAQKRQLNRRGGPALPDLRERQRTVRSLIVSQVIPGAAETLEASGIFKVRRTGGRGRKARLDDGSDSDDLELEDSGPESPAPSNINAGTARTRVMRGAAANASSAMRNALGRSQTPDVLQMEQTSRPTRRSAAHELREDTDEPAPATLVVKLRISPPKYRQWMARRKFGRSGAPPLSGFPTSQTIPPKSSTPQPNPAVNIMRPPTTPGLAKQTLPVVTPTPLSQVQQSEDNEHTASSDIASTTEHHYNHQGRIDATHTPGEKDAVPPPPPWLNEALKTLRSRHPNSSFNALMRFSTIDADTNDPVRFDTSSLPPGAPPPDVPVLNAAGEVIGKNGRLRWQWLPRIRCNDCPGKLYTAVPGSAALDFEVHLKNRSHRERVEKRVRRGSGAS